MSSQRGMTIGRLLQASAATTWLGVMRSGGEWLPWGVWASLLITALVLAMAAGVAIDRNAKSLRSALINALLGPAVLVVGLAVMFSRDFFANNPSIMSGVLGL